MRKHYKGIHYIVYVEILAFVFIQAQTNSALVLTSGFLKPLVRGQEYIF